MLASSVLLLFSLLRSDELLPIPRLLGSSVPPPTPPSTRGLAERPGAAMAGGRRSIVTSMHAIGATAIMVLVEGLLGLKMVPLP